MIAPTLVRGARTGTSMIELIASLALLIIACLAVVTLITAEVTLNRDVVDDASHMLSAQQKLDQLMASNVTIGTTYSPGADRLPLWAESQLLSSMAWYRGSVWELRCPDRRSGHHLDRGSTNTNLYAVWDGGAMKRHCVGRAVSR